ncbi:hypothetical protein Hypma_004372 [Hypsizygus marmoreus]|uniref:Uncharacterized protein n=1 Tax=Hypsizygus marmoreus TaxID=39966 RepID=A0A369JY71_HYPMA|nr:hypothetical protein Hypma_004372 [Hypsizygus marmoreus]
MSTPHVSSHAVDHLTSAHTLSSPFHRLGKFFGLKSGSPSRSGNSPSSSPSRSRGTSPARTGRFLSRPTTDAGHRSHSPDGSTSSHATTKVSASRLNHSTSTPNMCVDNRTDRPASVLPMRREEKRGSRPVGPIIVSLLSGLQPSIPANPRHKPTDDDKKPSLSPTTYEFGTVARSSSARRTPESSVSPLSRDHSFTPCNSPSPVSKTFSTFLQPESAHIARRHSTLAWTEPLESTTPLSPLFSPIPSDDSHLTPATSIESLKASDRRRSRKPWTHSRRGSVNKLARTLGVCPPDLNMSFDVGQTPHSPNHSERSFSTTEETYIPAKEPLSLSKASKRRSLSLTTFASLPSLFRSRSPSHGDGKHITKRSPSRISLSTVNTDDVHRFDLADDLSDTWGEVRDDSHSCSPISPITFHPPSPLPRGGGVASSTLSHPPSDNMKREPETAGFSLSSSLRRPTALTRARSQSYISSSESQSAFSIDSRAHTPFQELQVPETETWPLQAKARLPVKANWLDSSSLLSSEQNSKQRQEATGSGPESRDWIGEWNQDDMQQVIKMLRQLK